MYSARGFHPRAFLYGNYALITCDMEGSDPAQTTVACSKICLPLKEPRSHSPALFLCKSFISAAP